jgi:hypothetical protein
MEPKGILVLIVVAILLYLLYRYYNAKKEGMCQTVATKYRQFIMTKKGQNFITDRFRFKSWDGSDFEARLSEDGKFYVNKRGNNFSEVLEDIQVLRFRSMQWQVAVNGNYFILSRLNGVLDLNMDMLDLIDWTITVTVSKFLPNKKNNHHH